MRIVRGVWLIFVFSEVSTCAVKKLNINTRPFKIRKLVVIGAAVSNHSLWLCHYNIYSCVLIINLFNQWELLELVNVLLYLQIDLSKSSWAWSIKSNTWTFPWKNVFPEWVCVLALDWFCLTKVEPKPQHTHNAFSN